MKYDHIGKTYNSTRVPDERITNALLTYLDLPLNARILDVGAGTGNYSYELAKKGFKVTAVEPSATMRGQGKQHENLEWLHGFAEALPMEDDSVDGLICTLASHHFNDLELAFREMARVVKEQGKIVIFTADPRLCLDNCWIWDYFSEIVDQSCQNQPEMDALKRLFEANTSRSAIIQPFLLPHDLKDRFFFSGWRTPDAYLDEGFSSGISSLAAAPKPLLANNLKRLSEDLSSGKWQKKYGDLLNLDEYDCGYFFLVGGSGRVKRHWRNNFTS